MIKQVIALEMVHTKVMASLVSSLKKNDVITISIYEEIVELYKTYMPNMLKQILEGYRYKSTYL